MADIYRFKQARKFRSAIIPPGIASALACFEIYPGRFTLFGLNKRRKTRLRDRRIEVWLWTKDGHGLNLSAVKNVHPTTEQEARNYITTFAQGNGLILTEKASDKPRFPRPSREDATLLKQGIVREEWLESDVPELWAGAMVRCGHAGGYCGSDGFCHTGGCGLVPRPVSYTVERSGS